MPRARLGREQAIVLGRRGIGMARVVGARLGLDRTERYRRHVGFAVNVLLAILFAVLLYQNQGTLPLLTHVVTPLIVGGCFVFYLASLLLQFVAWAGLMQYSRADLGRALEEYIRTIFMGRLPGGLWKLVGRMTVYRAPHHTLRAIVAINLAEIGLALLANTVLLLVLMELDWLLRVAGLGGVLIVAYMGRRAGGATLADHRAVSWLLWVVCYMLSWVCGAMMVYMIVTPFGAALPLLDILRFWCIAGAAGIVLQVLPLSSLVRDMTLVAMLQGSMPLAGAVVAGFAVRLFLSVSELLTGWLLLWLLGLLGHRDREPSVRLSK